METTINLTHEQTRKLKNLYNEYQAPVNDEDLSYKEVNEIRDECEEAFRQQFPDLAAAGYKLMSSADLIYSKNQLQFIEDAQDASLDIDYSYSGRGMYGDSCPAVRVDYVGDFDTSANVHVDSMGLGVVIYARY